MHETIIIDNEDEKHVKIDEMLQKYFFSECKFRFSARIDFITNDALWEVKCSASFNLLVILFRWIVARSDVNLRWCTAFNSCSTLSSTLRSIVRSSSSIIIAPQMTTCVPVRSIISLGTFMARTGSSVRSMTLDILGLGTRDLGLGTWGRNTNEDVC